MRKMKWLAALLALCLLLAALPAATMEDLAIDDNAAEVFIDGEMPDDELEIPPEFDAPEDDRIDLESQGIDLSGLELAMPEDEVMGEPLASNATGSLVKITKPLNGVTVNTGKVALWCTFVNEDPTGGFSASDAWKYVPLRVQVMKNNEIVSDNTVSDYSWLTFTDEGLQYATVYLMEAGAYTIRVRVPGNAENVWDSIQVTVKGASVTPAPGATRKPVTDENLIVITSPSQGDQVVYNGIPLYVKYQNNGTLDADLYNPIQMEVLGDKGNLVLGTESETNDTNSVLDRVVSGEAWKLDTIKLDVGGNYTIRVKTAASSEWDSVQVFAVGPTYPEALEGSAHTITPGQSEVTIDLAKEKKARLTYSMRTTATPGQDYVYYADFVEGGDEIIDCKGISENTFTYDEKKSVWTCDGWIDYAGVKVGSTTLHMYMLVNGTRYDHHAVTVNVIDSSKISASTPAPTSTPRPTTAPKKVSLSKCKFTVKNQVYTGKKLTPAVTVKYGSKALKKGTDYKVTYSANKAVGTATATVKGKGNYTGTKKLTFKILPPAVTLSKVKAGAKSFTATWKQGKANTGYQLQYALKKSFSGAKTVKVAKAKTLSKTVKSLASGKTYYVRVRAYRTVGGKTYYSAWSAAKSVKVK